MLPLAVVAGYAAEKRVALVIGNAAYLHADKLVSPLNDARGMRDALRNLGFDVVYGEDLYLSDMLRTIRQFADRVDSADVAMVYYSGHGATFDNTPYAVPVDARFSRLDEVTHDLVPLEQLVGDLRRAAGMRIAIFDACRDNAAERELTRPATSRATSVERGLAPLTRDPGGSIIAYATGPNGTCGPDDVGGTGHSPFTAALLNNIGLPGIDVQDMFRRVAREVVAVTGGRQRPEFSSTIFEPYALAPVAVKPEDAKPAATAPAAATPMPTVPEAKPEAGQQTATVNSPPPAPPPAGPAADDAMWSVLKDTTNPELLRLFIEKFPASPRRREAEERIKALRQANVAAAPAPLVPTVKPPPPVQHPRSRVALVIGNGAYKHLPALNNPPNDARDLAAALKKLDFDVDLGVDLTLAEMQRKVTAFARRAQRAEVALAFYAGHGMQAPDQRGSAQTLNYLLPVDANIKDEADLGFTLTARDIVARLQLAASIRILILDACRHNPIPQRLTRARGEPASRGLRREPQTNGTLIAYSTQPDATADDGVDRNSPFVKALLAHIAEPGLDIRLLLADVRRDVVRSSKGKQTPETSDSLDGRFAFRK
jgi:uncharacterized caspase-like protein